MNVNKSIILVLVHVVVLSKFILNFKNVEVYVLCRLFFRYDIPPISVVAIKVLKLQLNTELLTLW